MELVAGRPFKKMQIINMVLQQDPWSSSLWFVRAFCETWTFLTFQTCMNKEFLHWGSSGSDLLCDTLLQLELSRIFGATLGLKTK